MDNSVIKLVILLSLIISSVLIYNQHQKNEIIKYKIAEEAKIKQEQKQQEISQKDIERAEQKQEEDLRKAAIYECLISAYNNYSQNWANACREANKRTRNIYNVCISTISDISLCHVLPNFEYSPDCSLPNDVSDTINQYYKNAKKECYIINSISR